MATTAAPAREVVVAAVEELERRGVLVLDRRAVLAFLRAHAEILPTVQRVANAAIEQLGERCELSLEVYRDPEIGSKLLVLYARQSPNEPDLLSTIHAIMEKYWQLPPDATGWFQLMTDFQRPRRR
jgi:hypothetical protein